MDAKSFYCESIIDKILYWFERSKVYNNLLTVDYNSKPKDHNKYLLHIGIDILDMSSDFIVMSLPDIFPVRHLPNTEKGKFSDIFDATQEIKDFILKNPEVSIYTLQLIYPYLLIEIFENGEKIC